MKNILITGASGNLGKTLLAAFEKEDAYHLNITTREKTSETSHLKAFHADLLNDLSATSLIEEIVETQGQLDAVICLTGGYMAGDLSQTSASDIHKMIEVNFNTAFNVAAPLIKINRLQHKKIRLIFIGAKAAMDSKSAVPNVAYALSKQLLFHYTEQINTSEKVFGTEAYILLPGTLDTAINRNVMPDADFSSWTKPETIIDHICKIIDGLQLNAVIEL